MGVLVPVSRLQFRPACAVTLNCRLCCSYAPLRLSRYQKIDPLGPGDAFTMSTTYQQKYDRFLVNDQASTISATPSTWPLAVHGSSWYDPNATET